MMAKVFAAFVSIRNFRTWTLTPLDDRLLAFLCRLLLVRLSVLVTWRPSLKKLEQSDELLFLRLIGSFMTWLEDVDMVGLVIWSFDGYDTEIMTFSRQRDDPKRRFRSKLEPDDDWFALNVSRFDVELEIGKSLRWLFDLFPRWMRNVTFSSSTWLFLTHLPLRVEDEQAQCIDELGRVLCVWQIEKIHVEGGNFYFKIDLFQYAEDCLKIYFRIYAEFLCGFFSTSNCSYPGMNKSLLDFLQYHMCLSPTWGGKVW